MIGSLNLCLPTTRGTTSVWVINVNLPHSVQMCATATFKRGYKENCSDCVDFKIGGVNYVSSQALMDMVTDLQYWRKVEKTDTPLHLDVSCRQVQHA